MTAMVPVVSMADVVCVGSSRSFADAVKDEIGECYGQNR